MANELVIEVGAERTVELPKAKLGDILEFHTGHVVMLVAAEGDCILREPARTFQRDSEFGDFQLIAVNYGSYDEPKVGWMVRRGR